MNSGPQFQCLPLLILGFLASAACSACPPLPFRLRPDGSCPLTYRECADHLVAQGNRLSCSRGELALSLRVSPFFGFLVSSTYDFLECPEGATAWLLPNGMQAQQIEAIACVLPMPCQSCTLPAFLTASEAATGAIGSWSYSGEPDVVEEIYSKCLLLSCKRDQGVLVERRASGQLVEVVAAMCTADGSAWMTRSSSLQSGSAVFCANRK